MAVEFVPIDRNTPYLFPPSIQDYLPEDHLARFVAEIEYQLDMSDLLGVYAGKGKKPYHPAMLVALLFYGYATGTLILVVSWRRRPMTRSPIGFCVQTHTQITTLSRVSASVF